MNIQDLISKWIKEANEELLIAKKEVNLRKMAELAVIIKKLSQMREH